jgi:hypothetical protein
MLDLLQNLRLPGRRDLDFLTLLVLDVRNPYAAEIGRRSGGRRSHEHSGQSRDTQNCRELLFDYLHADQPLFLVIGISQIELSWNSAWTVRQIISP